jgi:hypothetical protein
MPNSSRGAEEPNLTLIAALGRPRTVLDVGCAIGRRLSHSEVTRFDAANAEASWQGLGSQKFDAIAIDAALPNLELRQVLERAQGYLEPEGHVLVSIRSRAATNGASNPAGASRGDVEKATNVLGELGLEVLRVEQRPALARALRPFAIERVVVARRRPKPGPLSLTVGMLTMNEADSIERMMNEIRRVAPDARILCVDSSTKDDTHLIAERMGARVIRQLPPRGHGPAMEVLMYEAAKETDALIYLDCDFTYPPEVIPNIRKILEGGVDVVNAARTRSRPDAMPVPNYLANKSFALIAHATSGAKVADVHSGMRGYRSSLTRAFSFDGEGDAIPIDTLLWPAKCGYRVVEVPIHYQERVGVSKLRKVAGTVWTFIRLAKTLRVGGRARGHYEVWDKLDG